MDVVLLNALIKSYEEKLKQIFKYHSPKHFLFKVLKSFREKPEELGSKEMMTCAEFLQNMNFEDKEMIPLMDLIAEIFYRSSQSQTNLLNFFKTIKIHMGPHVIELIKCKYEVFNEELSKCEKKNVEKIKMNFRGLIKQVYGQIFQFGVDEEMNASNPRLVLLLTFSTASFAQKINIFSKIVNNFQKMDKEGQMFIAQEVEKILQNCTNFLEFCEFFGLTSKVLSEA